MTALRVAFAGTPAFAVPALGALAASRHRVVGVLTQPDRPRGRGRATTPGPVKLAALAHGFAIAQPPRLSTPEGQAPLAHWQPEVLVVVAYGQLLPPAVLALPRLGAVNIHASLLPRWRGAAPIQRAILAGDRITGVTIMQLDTGLDTGPMLLQRSLEIAPGVNSARLHDQLAALGAGALITALDQLAAGTARGVPQPAEGVTYAAKIDKSEAVIDWRRPAAEIERQVRAFNPWPIAETRVAGEQLRIHAARASEEDPGAVPGTVLGLRADALAVACGGGTLYVTELQRAGRRPVAARDFANSLPSAARSFG